MGAEVRARKVMHVITRLDHGGSARNTMLTVLGHEYERFQPIVVAGTSGRWDAQGGAVATELNRQRLEAAGVSCCLIDSLTREVNPIKDLLALRALMRLLGRERPALVHTHTSKAGALGRLAAWLSGIPAVVHTPHGHVFYGHFGALASHGFLLVERLLARVTTRLIALTEAERDEHLARRVGPWGRFAVIPSGIDVERFRAVMGVTGSRPQGLEIPPDAIVVGSVGWLTPIKGHRFLVEAVARLVPTNPRLHLLIVGSGELQEELNAAARRLGIGHALTLAGPRDDVPDCLACMDIFVLPSLNEGMGRALVEAMAAGRPVVATQVGGVPALIQHQRTGLLVPPADAAALADALAELVDRPAWAKELGAAASASISQVYDARGMVRAIEAVYEDALMEAGQG